MAKHSSNPKLAAVLSELARVVLDEGGDQAVVAGVRSASYLDATLTQVALATGLTRTRLYAVLNRADDQVGDVDRRSLSRMVAPALDHDAPLGVVAHARRLQVRADAMHRAFDHLVRWGAAELLVGTRSVESGPVTELYYVPGEQYETWMKTELDSSRSLVRGYFSVYIELPPDVTAEVGTIAPRIGGDVLGVIRAGTVSAVTWDELAIAVPALDARDALETARDVWNQIWAEVEEAAPPFSVRELIPPARRHGEVSNA